MTDITELKDKIEQLKKEFKEAALTHIRESAQALFDKYPELESFSWAQYTPYFNDGEPCVFGIDTDYFSINGSEKYDECWGDRYPYYPAEGGRNRWSNYKPGERDEFGWYDSETGKYLDEADVPWQAKVHEEISNILTPFAGTYDKETHTTTPDYTLRDIFGDHVEIVITKEGYSVRDYDHD